MFIQLKNTLTVHASTFQILSEKTIAFKKVILDFTSPDATASPGMNSSG